MYILTNRYSLKLMGSELSIEYERPSEYHLIYDHPKFSEWLNHIIESYKQNNIWFSSIHLLVPVERTLWEEVILIKENVPLTETEIGSIWEPVRLIGVQYRFKQWYIVYIPLTDSNTTSQEALTALEYIRPMRCFSYENGSAASQILNESKQHKSNLYS